MGRRARLFIAECTSESKENMSEGQLLREVMRILGFEKQTSFKVIRNRGRFFRELGEMKEPYLHISAHGDFDPEKGTWIKFPLSEGVYSNELQGIWDNKTTSRIPKLVILSACRTGHVDMVRAFSNSGCQYCIAPLHDTSWEDAAIFSTIFYKLLIGEQRSPWVSFKKTVVGITNTFPRLSGAWSFYRWGEKLSVNNH